ncbi:hypothetical protein BB559_005231 [Furculomyces boomerangus]|uniref:Rab-GAP TBC domain-containing protein n=1 Tax=Furculomyces boomerangus TaxID=61424 RepID=A0A2T9Y9X4_9FUNG|nr:hypothetical protein BB559_005231 [Furculomyces boomerangus]
MSSEQSGSRLNRMSPNSEPRFDTEIFLEILDSEVFVDLGRLRKCSRNGIPEKLRPTVWKYLLGVEKPDRSNELSLRKDRAGRYAEMDKNNSDTGKRIRGEVNRYFQRLGKNNFFDPREDTSKFESIICAYLNSNNQIEYKPSFVQMCAPFVHIIPEEYDAYYCFESLMTKIEDYSSVHSTNQQVAQFLSYFRAGFPDMYSNFEDEEINFSEFVSIWLKALLAPQLPLSCVLRLWDVYFSMPDFMEFHPFVCLSILSYLKDSLEELEHSEIKAVIFRLPELDVSSIVNHAVNLQRKIDLLKF